MSVQRGAPRPLAGSKAAINVNDKTLFHAFRTGRATETHMHNINHLHVFYASRTQLGARSPGHQCICLPGLGCGQSLRYVVVYLAFGRHCVSPAFAGRSPARLQPVVSAGVGGASVHHLSRFQREKQRVLDMLPMLSTSKFKRPTEDRQTTDRYLQRGRLYEVRIFSLDSRESTDQLSVPVISQSFVVALARAL